MSVRRNVLKALEQKNFDLLEQQYQLRPAEVLRNLQLHVYGPPNEERRWYAIDFLGKLTALHVDEDIDTYRNIIRRFIWQMCEESANVPWASPEICMVIINNGKKHFLEFIGPTFYHAGLNEICHAGLFWGLGQLDDFYFEKGTEFLDETLPRLTHPDIYANGDDLLVAGYGAWCFTQHPYKPAVPYLEELLDDDREIEIFFDNSFTTYKIKDLAQKAIDLANAN